MKKRNFKNRRHENKYKKEGGISTGVGMTEARLSCKRRGNLTRLPQPGGGRRKQVLIIGNRKG